MFHFLFFLINISLEKTDNQKRQHHLPQSVKENGLYSKCITLRNKLKRKVRLGQQAENVCMEDAIRDFSPKLGLLFDGNEAFYSQLLYTKVTGTDLAVSKCLIKLNHLEFINYSVST